MLKPFKLVFLVMLSVLLLEACSTPSIKQESAKTVKAAKTSFHEKAKKTNHKSGNVEFYLPFGYEIKTKSPNNIILKNGSKMYILFVNPKEATSSDIVYKASQEQYKKLAASEKFTLKNQLGYVLLAPLKDDLNELTVGIGGTKLTTETKTASLQEEAKTMMQIVKSVKID